jgi:hypothetical protein
MSIFPRKLSLGPVLRMHWIFMKEPKYAIISASNTGEDHVHLLWRTMRRRGGIPHFPGFAISRVIFFQNEEGADKIKK